MPVRQQCWSRLLCQSFHVSSYHNKKDQACYIWENSQPGSHSIFPWEDPGQAGRTITTFTRCSRKQIIARICNWTTEVHLLSVSPSLTKTSRQPRGSCRPLEMWPNETRKPPGHIGSGSLQEELETPAYGKTRLQIPGRRQIINTDYTWRISSASLFTSTVIGHRGWRPRAVLVRSFFVCLCCFLFIKTSFLTLLTVVVKVRLQQAGKSETLTVFPAVLLISRRATQIHNVLRSYWH